MCDQTIQTDIAILYDTIRELKIEVEQLKILTQTNTKEPLGKARMNRTPYEIIAVFNQAQELLGKDFDLQALLWEVIEDILVQLDDHSNLLYESTDSNIILQESQERLFHYLAVNYASIVYEGENIE